MNWKVVYEKDGREDCLWYGKPVDESERDRRLMALSDMGFNILGCYKVDGII